MLKSLVYVSRDVLSHIFAAVLVLFRVKGQNKATASCHTPNRVYTK